ncbi:HicA toxin of toxin-antitoxin [Salegentibacter holothuriorum]|uniref:HicA toxin of toxin-antitoxin n=1 Tax=Salegentibacter holothuriorum TaxID=241145 RepID=A0A1T5C5W9_9FLAO|nr:type II toxin-antitoxin system HicA family toxin [Salegentibacter holothuriorum]SKB54908.1 HicA toxin of toxin-antitoxin [Salegentibacter holothuriorum]
MSKIEKLVQKFLGVPKDMTWEEFSKVLKYYGYIELKKKGKTGGSRRKFINRKKNNDVIIAHKPHPENVVKRYIIEQVIEKLGL